MRAWHNGANERRKGSSAFMLGGIYTPNPTTTFRPDTTFRDFKSGITTHRRLRYEQAQQQNIVDTRRTRQ